MDLNRLYSLHQIALIRASNTDDRDERELHHAEADGIASCISKLHDCRGTDPVPLMPAALL